MRYNSKFLAEIQAIANIGGWQYFFSEEKVTWTVQIYYIHGLSTEIKPSLDNVLSMYTNQSKELFLKVFKDAHTYSIPFNIELKLKEQKNGRDAWVRAIGRPFKKEGEVYKISGIFQDITEEKESQELAKMGEWGLNFNSGRTKGSVEICKQFGLNAYDFDLSIEEYYKKVHPNDIEKVKAAIKTTIDQNFCEFETRIIQPDGTIKFIQCTIKPSFDENKNIIGIYGSSVDISELRGKEEKLRDYKTIFNITNEFVCIVNFNWKFNLLNVEFENKLGFSDEEFGSKSMLDFLCPEDIEETKKAFEAISKNDKQSINSFKNRMITKNGNYLHTSWNVVSDIDKGVYYCIGRDITKQIEYQEAIANSEQRLKEAQKAAKIGSYEFNIKTSECYWSDQMKQIHEVSDDFQPTLENTMAFYDAKSLRRIKGAAKKGIKKKQAYDLKLCIITNTGKQKWLRNIGNIYFEKEKAIKFSGLCLDITKEVTNEKKANNYFNGLKLINDISSAVYSNFDQLIINSLEKASKFLGMNVGFLIFASKTNFEIKHSSKNTAILNSSLQQKMPIADSMLGEFWDKKQIICSGAKEEINLPRISFLNKNSSPTSFAIAPTLAPGGIFHGSLTFFGFKKTPKILSGEDQEFLNLFSKWLGTILDRQQKNKILLKSKNSAEKATKLKSAFVSSVSHEIRTPLNAVIGLTNLLLFDNPKPEQIEKLKTLKFSGENLLVIINDLLDFSKLEAGKVKLDEIDFNLPQLVNKIKKTLEFNANDKGILLKLNLDTDIPEMLVGDTVRISQILTNLVNNAIKFTEKGKVSILIEMEEETNADTTILFSVKDTGIGIPQDKLGSIFQQFTQAKSDTTRKFGGTGLGLAIVKDLLNVYGSTIKVKSEIGVGTEFYFTLKLKKGKSGTVVEMPKVEVKNEKNLNGMKILIAEDNAINQFVIRNFLTKWKADITFANNGKTALKKVQEQHYDLVLMDLEMPEMDGFEAAKNIKRLKEDRFKKLPIIALSASVLNEVKNKIYKFGMVDYVSKPFKPEKLYEKIITHTSSLGNHKKLSGNLEKMSKLG